MGKKWKLYKKLHRWPGLLISFVLLYYALTGIFMNHREMCSGLDVNRDILPENYRYSNWNNAALRNNLMISPDSILIYGNIGIWLTDTAFTNYASFNSGFPKGIDNRKISDIHQDRNGEIYAATLFGFYAYNRDMNKWQKLDTGSENERFTSIESHGDTLYVINRSHLFKGISKGIYTGFTQIELPPPAGYVRKVSLFQTIWQIHSGEIFGIPGKIFVDLLGVITMFLSVTGIIYFFFPGWIKSLMRRNKPAVRVIRISNWSLRWHNKVGAWTFVFLIILFLTGMFLRPPLLIAITKAEVSPLKYTRIHQPNPWYDKLRDIRYDAGRGIMLLSTSEGMFYMDSRKLIPARFLHQPPVSVMGINVFESHHDSSYLIGSFSGIFSWIPGKPEIYNLVTGALHTEIGSGRPVGDLKVTGALTDHKGNLYLVDYDQGIIPLGHYADFPQMPENILTESGISLWSVCLEIHTGRFFQNILGSFYILIVPLTGIAGIIIVISGYILWRRKYRSNGYRNIS